MKDIAKPWPKELDRSITTFKGTGDFNGLDQKIHLLEYEPDVVKSLEHALGFRTSLDAKIFTPRQKARSPVEVSTWEDKHGSTRKYSACWVSVDITPKTTVDGILWTIAYAFSESADRIDAMYIIYLVVCTGGRRVVRAVVYASGELGRAPWGKETPEGLASIIQLELDQTPSYGLATIKRGALPDEVFAKPEWLVTFMGANGNPFLVNAAALGEAMQASRHSRGEGLANAVAYITLCGVSGKEICEEKLLDGLSRYCDEIGLVGYVAYQISASRITFYMPAFCAYENRFSHDVLRKLIDECRQVSSETAAIWCAPSVKPDYVTADERAGIYLLNSNALVSGSPGRAEFRQYFGHTNQEMENLLSNLMYRSFPSGAVLSREESDYGYINLATILGRQSVQLEPDQRRAKLLKAVKAWIEETKPFNVSKERPVVAVYAFAYSTAHVEWSLALRVYGQGGITPSEGVDVASLQNRLEAAVRTAFQGTYEAPQPELPKAQVVTYGRAEKTVTPEEWNALVSSVGIPRAAARPRNSAEQIRRVLEETKNLGVAAAAPATATISAPIEKETPTMSTPTTKSTKDIAVSAVSTIGDALKINDAAIRAEANLIVSTMRGPLIAVFDEYASSVDPEARPVVKFVRGVLPTALGDAAFRYGLSLAVRYSPDGNLPAAVGDFKKRIADELVVSATERVLTAVGERVLSPLTNALNNAAVQAYARAVQKPRIDVAPVPTTTE